MLPTLAQSPLIAPTVRGVAEFLHQGVLATRVNMTCAVGQVEAGMSLVDFVEIARAQHAHFTFIEQERGALLQDARLQGADRKRLDRFQSHVTQRDDIVLMQWLKLIDDKPSCACRLFEEAREMYRVTPSVYTVVREVIERHALATDRDVAGFPPASHRTVFATRAIEAGAAALFDKLTDYAVRHVREGGVFQFVQRAEDLRTIALSGDGLEADAASTEELGRMARTLGWALTIASGDAKGTELRLRLRDGDLAPMDPTRPNVELVLPPDDLIPAARFVEGAKIFAGAEPFAGYKIVLNHQGLMIDVSRSPIYRAIVQAREVREYLVRHASAASEGMK